MYGKTSVTLTIDELVCMKRALNYEAKKLNGYVADGDPHGVWTEELNEVRRAYKKIERALNRV